MCFTSRVNKKKLKNPYFFFSFYLLTSRGKIATILKPVINYGFNLLTASNFVIIIIKMLSNEIIKGIRVSCLMK